LINILQLFYIKTLVLRLNSVTITCKHLLI